VDAEITVDRMLLVGSGGEKEETGSVSSLDVTCGRVRSCRDGGEVLRRLVEAGMRGRYCRDGRELLQGWE